MSLESMQGPHDQVWVNLIVDQFGILPGYVEESEFVANRIEGIWEGVPDKAGRRLRTGWNDPVTHKYYPNITGMKMWQLLAEECEAAGGMLWTDLT